MTSTADLAARSDAVTDALRNGVLNGERLQIVKAPPGAGKTYLLLELVSAAFGAGQRVAVATFTNAQSDDVCRRLVEDHPSVPVVRFLSHSALDPELDPRVVIVRKASDLPHGPCVVVANTSKWGFATVQPFDIMLVDEAWQVAWADFLLLRSISARFVLIGDPGQIPPVVSIPTERWETSPNAPHIPTPELLLNGDSYRAVLHELPGSRRLPGDAVELVNEFYDFEFGAFAAPDERFLRLTPSGGSSRHDRALDLLAEASIVGITVPTPDDGPPAEVDHEVAREVATTIERLLDRDPHASDCAQTAKSPVPLQPRDIGIVSTHRTMNTALHYCLPHDLQHEITTETPERWQGLERKVMIAVHPLSGVTDPSSFELETGRLCVMASRHRCALMMVTRDHIPHTLREHIVSAEQPIGRGDIAGVGHHRHGRFWGRLADDNRVVAL